jgi:hypothetical protein
MYKIKRFSSLTREDDTKKLNHIAKSGVIGGFAGYKIGSASGSIYGSNKYNKWIKNINEKQIPELVNRAKEGSEFAADTLRQLNHPRTKLSFKDIAKNTIRRSSKIGSRIGAGVGLATGIGLGIKKYKKTNK